MFKEILQDLLKTKDEFKKSNTFEITVLIVRGFIKFIPRFIVFYLYCWLCFKIAEYLNYQAFSYEEPLDGDVSIMVNVYKITITIIISVLLYLTKITWIHKFLRYVFFQDED